MSSESLLYARRARIVGPPAFRGASAALGGAGHRSHTGQGEAIGGYIRWRNTRAEPKRDFAPDSVIRTWTDYKINVG